MTRTMVFRDCGQRGGTERVSLPVKLAHAAAHFAAARKQIRRRRDCVRRLAMGWLE